MSAYPSTHQELETKVSPITRGVTLKVMGNGTVRGQAKQSGLTFTVSCVHDYVTRTVRDLHFAHYEANKASAFEFTADESATTFTRCFYAEANPIVDEPRPGGKFKLTTRLLTSAA